MKNLKRKVKENKGITLIMLVITIIVLIILAAITIKLVMGENGIHKKAQLGAEQYSNAQEYEQTQLENYSEKMDEMVGNSSSNEQVTLTKEQWETIQDTISDLNTKVSTLETNLNNRVVLYNNPQRQKGSSTEKTVDLATTEANGGITYTISDVPKNFKKIEITVGMENYSSDTQKYYYPYIATYEWDVETSPDLYLRDFKYMDANRFLFYQINMSNNSTSVKLYDQGHKTWNGVYIKSIVGYK